MESFQVIYRNHGHWDIHGDKGRMYKIRGGPGNYRIINDIEKREPSKPFKTVNACMAYICDYLMFELILVKNQKPHTIEEWNI